mgnify:FL=1|jgi:hypothetical protein
MPSYDWFCKKCDNTEKDVWYHKSSDVPKTRACACGGHMEQDFSSKGRNQIHLSHSSLYGRWEPAVAERIDSYSDKQKIMKKYNIVEANDPVKGSREHRIEPPKSSSIRSEWADKPNNAKM